MNETSQGRFYDTHSTVLESCDPTSYPTTTTVTTWDQGYTNSRSGTSNPFWRRLVASGQDATTSFDGVLHRLVRYSPGSFYIRYGYCPQPYFPRLRSGNGCQSGRVAVVSSVPGESGTAALNQAKTAFVKKAKKHINPFQGMVALGELNKTLRMLKSPLRSLMGGLKTYHSTLKKVPKGLKSELRKKALTDTYLEFTYGVTPLLGDIQGARELLADLRSKRPFEIIRISGRGKQVFAAYESYGTTSGGVNYNNVDLITAEYSYIIRGGLKVSPVGCDPLAAAGFSFENFLPSAWELLPYSFLADYVANIGDIIDAFSLINGKLAWCSQSSRIIHRRKSEKISLPDVLYVNSVERSFKPGCHEFYQKIVSRRKLTSVIPDFGFRLPGFGSRQSLNAAVLALSKTVRTPFY